MAFPRTFTDNRYTVKTSNEFQCKDNKVLISKRSNKKTVFFTFIVWVRRLYSLNDAFHFIRRDAS